MKKIILMIALLFVSANLRSQTDFVNDNVLYNNIFPSELQEFLKANPDALLIDVRSPGEYSDTSRFGSLNIGHLKGAINIDIETFEERLDEVKNYTDKPIILYCSHSQRSRRVSKLLSGKGFKKIYNLNGGMSWMIHAKEEEFPGKKDLIVFSMPFKNLSAIETAEFISNTDDLVIIDVRTESEFSGKDSNEANNAGRLRNAINIPSAEIKNSLPKIEQYKEKNILIYDINGALSNHTARYLSENGFTKVHNLLGGLSAIHSKVHFKEKILENAPRYKILNVYETIDLIKENPALTILDVRSGEEYNNKDGMQWHNLGRIKGAVNLPPEKFADDVIKIAKDKKGEILIYGMGDFPAKAAKILTEKGYEDVNLMYGGLWSMVSTYANVKGYKHIKELMENYEGMW